ncbi:MAG: hypothetical protein P4N59_20390 [Negativicutes bacterium]|nr:hypothetical protein [Negativicutes bacterium]
MSTFIIIFILGLLFFVFFAMYKRQMLVKMFSLQASVPAAQLQEQLELTADTVLRRLDTQIAHLEMLLDEADNKIAMLDLKLQAADQIPVDSVQAVPSGQRSNVVDLHLPAEQPPLASAQAVNVQSDVSPVQPKDTKDTVNNDKRRQVVSMSGQGYSINEIAKNTGMGKGEIMLLLQLNRK